ncbi:MAG: hypothetical protein JJD92_12645 [Frankiaceae bacterium]|nr:hypothetical protein [Frankiaceae bacterium]
MAVVGMHRSATSAVASLLGKNGLSLGDLGTLMDSSAANPRGYAENTQVTEFDQHVLTKLGGDWWAPPTIDAIDAAADDFVPAARALWTSLAATFEAGPPLVKDPRLALLLPVWRRVWGPETLYVFCHRDPMAVARSLLRRDGIDLVAGLSLWEVYCVSALRGLAGSSAIFVDADQLSADPERRRELVQLVRRCLALPTTDEFADTFDADLLGPPSTVQERFEHLTGAQLSLYRSLQRLPADVVAVEGLQHLRVPPSSARVLAQYRRTREALDRLTASDEHTAHDLRQARDEASVLHARVQYLEQETVRHRDLVAELAAARRAQQEDGQRLADLEARTCGLSEQLAEARQEVIRRKEDVDRLSPLAASAASLQRAVEQRDAVVGGLKDRCQLLETDQRRLAVQSEQTAAELKDRLKVLEQQLAAAQSEHEHAESDRLSLKEHANAEIRLQLAHAEESAARALAETAAVHAMYAGAFQSRSWRWTRFLRRERRQRKLRPAPDGGTKGRKRRPSIAVVAHVFYPELWEPLAAQLGNLRQAHDLFVSLTEGHTDHLRDEVRHRFPRAFIEVLPNRGRDVAPFFTFVNSGRLDGYKAVLKLHTKKSPHRSDGDEWRRALWHGLLPNPDDAALFADVVANDKSVGCIVPAGNIHGQEDLGPLVGRVRELVARTGAGFTPGALEFPAGSMYWLDGGLVPKLKQLDLRQERDFEPELGQTNGGTAHAVERVMGVLVRSNGQAIVTAESVRSNVVLSGQGVS